jgi:anti-sigma factor RsiW
MKIDDVEILRYVDNKLSKERRDKFECLLADSVDLQQRVKEMKASQLPYQAAFDTVDIPPMPRSIEDKFNQLESLIDDHSPVTKNKYPWLMVAGLCFSFFIAGVFFKGAINQWGLDGIASPQFSATPLANAMIQYQALYTRKTVEPVNQTKEDALKVLSRFNERVGAQFSIPDMQSSGYQFRRAQELSYEGQMILQLVYLPDNGDPIALCLTESGQVLPERNKAIFYQYANMNTLLWEERGATFMLMGTLSEKKVRSLLSVI